MNRYSRRTDLSVPTVTADAGETAFKTIYDKLPERLNAERILIPEHFEDYINAIIGDSLL